MPQSYDAWWQARRCGAQEDRAVQGCAASQAAGARFPASGACRAAPARADRASRSRHLRDHPQGPRAISRAEGFSHCPRVDPEHAPALARRGGGPRRADSRHAGLRDLVRAPLPPAPRRLRQGTAASHRSKSPARSARRRARLLPSRRGSVRALAKEPSASPSRTRRSRHRRPRSARRRGRFRSRDGHRDERAPRRAARRCRGRGR